MKKINKENFVLTVNNAKKISLCLVYVKTERICNIVIENNEKKIRDQ